MASLDWAGKPKALPRYAVVLPPSGADDTYDTVNGEFSLVGQSYSLGNSRQKSKPSFLRHLTVLQRHWWKITAFVLFIVGLTGYLSNKLQPMYESTVLIDADRQATSG